MGGYGRTERSRHYLFSGFLICGVCSARMVIATGAGKRAYVKYGCSSNRYRGTCSNGLMIRQDRLEAQLVTGLVERITRQDMIDYALEQFHDGLKKRLRELQEQALKAAGTVAALQDQRRVLKGQAQNLGEAIAKMGHSAMLLQQLTSVESEIERIDERLALANNPLDLAFSLETVRDFVTEKATDLRAAFDEETAKARQILAQHIHELVLTPRETETGPVYNVSGISTCSAGWESRKPRG